MAKSKKKTLITPSKKPAALAASHPNSAAVTHWLRAMLEVLPRGGKSIAAETLGITPPALSKILNRPERAFDEKTIRLLSWIEKSKAHKYDVAQFPIVEEFRVGNSMIIEKREQPAGPAFYVWRLPE